MTDDHLRDIFNQAVELTGADRTAFLDEACGADDALRAEVESLLQHYATEATVQVDTSEIISLSSSALVAATGQNPAVPLPERAVGVSTRQGPSVGSLPHVLQVPPRHRSELHRCDSLLNEPAAVDRDIPENLFLAIRPADDQFIDPVRFPDSHE